MEGGDDIVVQAAQDDRVHDDGAELFHQVECQTGPVVGDLVQEPDVWVQPDGADGGFDVVGQDGVAEGEEGVDRVAGRAAVATGKLPFVPLDEVAKDGKVDCRAAPFDAAERVDGLAASGTTLVITVDSCVSEVENIAHASSLGIDVIVTDHHEIPPQLPEAAAIINAKLPDSPYPYRYLAGAGLSWRLAGHLLEELADRRTANAPPWGGERWWDEALALAAIGSIADRVPLTGDNRVLIAEGLRVLPDTVRPGLRALLEASNLSGRALDYDDVQENMGSIFGRVSDGRGTNRAYEMLVAEDPEEAASIARELAAARQEWRSMANRAWKIVERAAGELSGESPVLIVEADVPIEVMGSATSRLAEKTGKPCLLIVKKNGEAHAEARGPAGYNFVVAFQSMGELFLGYGGHPRAAGFSIESSRVIEFRERMLAHAAEHPPVPTPRRVDAELALTDANTETATELAALAPFGQGWGRPVLLSRGVTRETVAAAEQNGLRFRTPMRVADGAVDLFYRLSVADEVLFASEVDRAPAVAGPTSDGGVT